MVCSRKAQLSPQLQTLLVQQMLELPLGHLPDGILGYTSPSCRKAFQAPGIQILWCNQVRPNVALRKKIQILLDV